MLIGAELLKDVRLADDQVIVDIKETIIKSLVWVVDLYVAETWTLQTEEVRRFEAFEMWVWIRKENVCCQERKTNVSVLASVREEWFLISTIRKIKNYFYSCHILMIAGQIIDVIEGRMEGKSPRWRRKMDMLDGLIDKRP